MVDATAAIKPLDGTSTVLIAANGSSQVKRLPPGGWNGSLLDEARGEWAPAVEDHGRKGIRAPAFAT